MAKEITGLGLGTYFSPRYTAELDDRKSFETIEEMVSFPETSLPKHGFITYNEATNKRYEFNIDNEILSVLGKWREVKFNTSKKEIPTWEANKDYKVDNQIKYNDEIYECIITHTSTTNFDDNTDKFVKIADGHRICTKTQFDYMKQNNLIKEDRMYVVDGIDEDGKGTYNYEDLENRPSINGILLTGNKTTKDLKLNDFIKSLKYSNRVLDAAYENDIEIPIDLSSLITGTSIGEFKDMNIANVEDKQLLSYDKATGKFIPFTNDNTALLKEAKDYTDEQIKSLNKDDTLVVDEKPTCTNGTITYKKDGETKTIANEKLIWFYYQVDGKWKQTAFVNDSEITIDMSGIDVSEYVNKNTDVANDYTGQETDLTKVASLASLKALQTIINNILVNKINKSDVVDDLSSTDTDKPLSANQGKVINDGLTAITEEIVNHEADEDKHTSKIEKDSYALKEKITDTIDKTSTSEDIASAKGVYGKLYKTVTETIIETKEHYELDTNGTLTIVDDGTNPSDTEVKLSDVKAKLLDTDSHEYVIGEKVNLIPEVSHEETHEEEIYAKKEDIPEGSAVMSVEEFNQLWGTVEVEQLSLTRGGW